MPKIVNGIEYLDYNEAADEYGLSRKSVQSMVSRGTFNNAKFSRDVKAYISREQLEAYKNRKNKTAIEPSTDTGKERSTQDVPFPLYTTNRIPVIAIGEPAITYLQTLLKMGVSL